MCHLPPGFSGLVTAALILLIAWGEIEPGAIVVPHLLNISQCRTRDRIVGEGIGGHLASRRQLFRNKLLILVSGTKFAGLDEWSSVLGNCFSILVF